MIKQNKQFFLRLLLVAMVVLLVNTDLPARMYLNKGGCPYESETCEMDSVILGDTAGISSASSTGINSLIIEGAGNFFNSQATALIFLNKIEISDISGVNFTDLRETLYETIKYMELANGTYSDLVKIAAAVPYRQGIIERLKGLNYEGFQTRNNLNGIIFEKVAQYLSKGDVTGLFRKVLVDSEMILDMLYEIKKTVDKEQIPPTRSMWKLAQAYSEFHMAGQYAAQVFYEVTDMVE